MPEHKAVAESIANNRNRYGAPNENRGKWLRSEARPAQRADVLYFVGCNSSFKQQELAQASARLLVASGTEFMILGEQEWCCGNPLYAVGLADQAKEVAEHNLKAIQESGAKTVVASCAECYQTLKVTYPKLLGKSTPDLGFEVMHLADLLDQQLQQGKLKFTTPVNMRITYQDPCHLGRLSEPWTHWEGKRGKFGIFDPPKPRRKGTYGSYDAARNLLNAVPGLQVEEMERRKDQAWCCGAGGGVRDAFKDFALWTAQERIEEAKQTTGAEAIVCACPYCRENLGDAIGVGEERMKSCDITEILLQAIGAEK
jgi:Fe-S oxidoreductase